MVLDFKLIIRDNFDFDKIIYKNVSGYGYTFGNYTAGQKIFDLINIDNTLNVIKGNCNLDSKIKFGLLIFSGKGSNAVKCQSDSECYGFQILNF